MADTFFTDEEVVWWGEAEPRSTSTPTVPPSRTPQRRSARRTFAGDVSSLGTAVARRSRVPPALLGLLGLGLLLAVAVVVRLALTGDEPPEQAAAASPPAATVPGASGTPASPASVTPAKPVTLEPGDRGAGVRELQVALTALGLYGGGTDGDYGPGTGAAVAAFQGASGLSADAVAGPATAGALSEALADRAQEDAAAARAGLAAAVDSGLLGEEAAEQARTTLADTLRAIRGGSPGRSAVLGLVLHDVAAEADRYTSARTPALFGLLDTNARRLASVRPRIEDAAVADGTGVVYRHFREHGYEFHPLASFATLNGVARRGERADAERLAKAMVARGVRSGDTLLWQYRFPFGGPPVWTSGFGQAVGAQSLAHAADLLGDRALMDAAGSAFRAIPRDLSRPLGGGTWVMEYGFTDMAVLNAQLQSIISLGEYVELSQDPEARTFVASMSDAARTLIPEFDTGCWSRYSLEGSPATTGYHTYHVKLLKRLAATTGDPVFRETADRWSGYLAAGPC